MISVFIVGGDAGVTGMYSAQSEYRVVNSYEEAQLIQFTGGADVSPEYYGYEPLPQTQSHPARDEEEFGIFERALVDKKICVGICRGAQFLNVANGGWLYQHVNGHALGGTHPVLFPEKLWYPHRVRPYCEWLHVDNVPNWKKRFPTDTEFRVLEEEGFDRFMEARVPDEDKGSLVELLRESGGLIPCTSTHHQMMIPGAASMTLGYSYESSSKNRGEPFIIPDEEVRLPIEDPEVVIYPRNRGQVLSLCFQPHPEYVAADHPCQKVFFELLHRVVLEGSIWWDGRNMRLTGADWGKISVDTTTWTTAEETEEFI